MRNESEKEILFFNPEQMKDEEAIIFFKELGCEIIRRDYTPLEILEKGRQRVVSFLGGLFDAIGLKGPDV